MMLSRTANSLFWMGRYIERIEHLSRYIYAQYLSSSDAPRAFNKKLMLDSMLHMADAENSYSEHSSQIEGSQVIFYLTLDDKNFYSIKNYISTVRENARGARDNISTELWEAINRFYHSSNAFTKEELERKGPYSFCKSAMDSTTIIKGVADHTLLRNEVWSIMRAGTHLERAMQIAQIMISKIHDIKKGPTDAMKQAIDNYHWAAMLRSAGGFDMSRHYYGSIPYRERAVNFLILDNTFPKSILYNLERLSSDLEIIGGNKHGKTNTVEFITGKLTAFIRFMTLEEILKNEEKFLHDLQEQLNTIGIELEQQYFTF